MSIFVLTAQTHPFFQRKLNMEEWQDYLDDEFQPEDMDAFYDDGLYYYDTIAADIPQSQNKTRFPRPFTTVQYLVIMDYVTTAFFTLDLMMRFLVCPYKLKFIFDFFNLMDLIALVAVFVHVTIEGILTKERYRASLLDLVLAFQVLRILRFLRMIKRVRGFRVLVYAMRVGFRELMTVAMFVFLAVISFGCIIYFLDGKTRIKHIPDGIYWALITVTTVGYGDIVPGTPQGKLVACCCALLGVLLTAVTVPVFVNNFVLYYSHASVLSLQEDIKKNPRLHPSHVQPNVRVITIPSLSNKKTACNKTCPVTD
ncbi:potassium voltage-gated channel subfamily C member 1-like [Patella vulgata]|uniref:potassium voltage-gated channel subfamily C member 1-like n=1 Tax=Patella vulgata TaxID=6465 RepID=UPI0024A7F376|nr:potassium voltage-gated channel subfamily C member 1-like [Patella vulgata]